MLVSLYKKNLLRLLLRDYTELLKIRISRCGLAVFANTQLDRKQFFANILHTSDNGKLPTPTHKPRTVFSALFEIKQITPFSIPKAASVITDEE